MEDCIGKTIVGVEQGDARADGFIIHFTDGTSIEVTADCAQNVGYVIVGAPEEQV